MTSPSDLEKASIHFERLLALEPIAREPYLSQLAETEPAMAEELRGMLADMNDAEHMFPERADTARTPGGDWLGQQLGPYQVIEKIGEGGMGQVFLAEKHKQDLVQKVAIKILFQPLTHPESLRRFRTERKILCELNHPNLVQFIDDGQTPEGYPFLVMEYVEGVSIADSCRNRPLPEVLSTFIQACQAVAFAHRQLIIHRDIKPGNILVTPEGQVKLLDFGVAKLLETPISADQSQWLPLTRDYASPEQLRGDVLSTATDIYSLGTVLFELITGQRLAHFERTSGDSVSRSSYESLAGRHPLRAALKAIPDGKRAQNARLAHVNADLEAILAKCLAPDAMDRYLTPTALAEDVEHFLNHRPVQARTANWFYLAGKFLKRQWLPASLAALAMVSLVVGLATTRYQANRALAAAEKQKEVTQFLVQVFESANPELVQGDLPTVDDLLQNGIRKVDEGLAQSPDLRASLHGVFGRIFIHLAKYSNASEAFEIYMTHYPDPESAGDVTEWLEHAEGLAESQIHLGRHEAATALLDRVVTVAENQGSQRGLASLHSLRGVSFMKQAQWDKAEFHFETAKDLLQDCVTLACRKEEIKLFINRSAMFIDMGQNQKAERALLQAREKNELLPAPNPLNQMFILSNLSSVYTRSGKPEQALPLHDALLDIKQRILGEDNPKLAITHQNRAQAYVLLGKLPEAKAGFLEAYRLFSTQDKESIYQAFPLVGLSRVLMLEGDTDQAIEQAEKALAIVKRFQGEGSHVVAQVEFQLGEALLAGGRQRDAVAVLTRAKATLENALGGNHALVKRATVSLEKAKQGL